MAKYLLTPKDGRVGKARQVKPFDVSYDGLPGDLNKLAQACTDGLRKYANKKYGIFSIVTVRPNDSFRYAVTLYHNGQPLAEADAEAVEE
jgi:hypothetical protein